MSLDRQSAEALLEQAISENLLEEGSRVPFWSTNKPQGSAGALASMTGRWSLASFVVEVVVCLPTRFPRELPTVLVSHAESLPAIPHLEGVGFVCCFEGEGLVPNINDPMGVLRETLLRAKETLRKGLSGENHHEVFEELESYWSYGARGDVKSNIEPNDVARELTVLLRKNICAVGDSRNAVVAQYKIFDATDVTQQKGLYVPLEGSVLQSQFYPRNLSSVEALRSFFREYTSDKTQKQIELFNQKRSSDTLFVLGFPKKDDRRTFVGLWLKGATKRPLFSNSGAKIERVNLERSDIGVMKQRAATADCLSSATITVVGCGALGGHLAFCLAWAGVRKLVLVDPDSFKPENVLRHVLGRSGIAKSKVGALAGELNSKVPGLEIQPIPHHLETALDTKQLKLEDCDLVIVTVGSPMASFQINQKLRSLPGATPTVFTWLEPYGIGGHSMLSLPGRGGCYECLFEEDPRFGLVSRADFAAPGQTFSKRDFGCSGLFVPYSDLDARETAQMATRHVLDTLKSSSIAPELRSWRGNSTDFTNAGFKLSLRYKDGPNTLPLKGRYARKECSACSANK